MRTISISILFLAGFLLRGVSPVSASTVAGSCLEDWELTNFQPQSASFGQPVKSSSFHPRVTVLLLLASW